ncbi:hypothetical protein E2C01_037409 [Portunus trituberculatus]|uniref:Uncharacterized protein n=1 Tax=Portunus trituberculatus TaxID=210409 RepID=A0A5B7FEJ0_PORTR|nr:hypothetical protein [Portunus trituberculatus]
MVENYIKNQSPLQPREGKEETGVKKTSARNVEPALRSLRQLDESGLAIAIHYMQAGGLTDKFFEEVLLEDLHHDDHGDEETWLDLHDQDTVATGAKAHSCIRGGAWLNTGGARHSCSAGRQAGMLQRGSPPRRGKRNRKATVALVAGKKSNLVLSLEHLLGAFVVMAAGFLIASFSLAVERCCLHSHA